MYLLNKGVPLIWDDFTQIYFDTLKKDLMSSPLLSSLCYGIDLLLYLTTLELTIKIFLLQPRTCVVLTLQKPFHI
jgi:hypothetical protein